MGALFAAERRAHGYRRAFANFDPEAVAKFGEKEVAALLSNPGIIRSRAKIEATIAGATDKPRSGTPRADPFSGSLAFVCFGIWFGIVASVIVIFFVSPSRKLDPAARHLGHCREDPRLE